MNALHKQTSSTERALPLRARGIAAVSVQSNFVASAAMTETGLLS